MEMKASTGQMSIGDQPATLQDIRLVLDTIPALAWSTGPDGSADFFNQRWLEYTGLTLEVSHRTHAPEHAIKTQDTT